ncbi:MAG: hypothetical protein COU51_03310 [Parcubacteria group bacterium CG10_big_fil_rev_8_21_14_0_10_36_14]|nr:MAG: hypothetical protein COU51_03310 [Parcubacteria group bacterium CG10_big_fil_rev_8_21_14_0_10_36_14]
MEGFFRAALEDEQENLTEEDKEEIKQLKATINVFNAMQDGKIKLVDEYKNDEEIKKELIVEGCQMSADMIVRALFETCLEFFEDGVSSLEVNELVEAIDFIDVRLDQELSQKYWPEIKIILRKLMPELLKESLVDVGERGDKQGHF